MSGSRATIIVITYEHFTALESLCKNLWMILDSLVKTSVF